MPQRDSTRTGLLAVTLLSVFAFAVAGYHPFVEDGGVYAAGIEKLLNPALFPTWTAFVTEHLRFSLFAPLVAAIVHLTHLSLEWTLLLLYVLSIWMTLFAAWLLATRITPKPAERLAAVSLLACWLTLPIAGTSLMLMDPYVTARSFTTPLALLALAWAVDALRIPSLSKTLRHSERSEEPLYSSRTSEHSTGTFQQMPETSKSQIQGSFASLRMTSFVGTEAFEKGDSGSESASASHASKLFAWLPCTLAIALAALLHPLMAGYALAAILCLAAAHRRKLRLVLGALAIATAGVLQWKAPGESPAYVRIASTRYYWFLSQWHWYEVLGLVAPLLILAAFRKRSTQTARTIAAGALLLGTIALLVALLFAHESYATHLVARLQPLRAFQIVYELMILLLGAWLGSHVLKNHLWRWAMLFAILGTPMFYAQRGIFPNSAPIEWPNAAPANPWQQAFVWVRANTPTGALFALDAHYITEGRHEDAQCFRAIAQRSALPDYSKDGGEASITPALTGAWAIGQAAQTNLETESDATRFAKLKPLGVTWAVLQSTSPTAWACPYQNSTVKVCRVP